MLWLLLLNARFCRIKGQKGFPAFVKGDRPAQQGKLVRPAASVQVILQP